MVSLALGIDFGTSGVRACVIDTGGAIRAEARADLPAPERDGAAVSQDPEHWWRQLEQLLDELAGRDALSRVERIAVDGTAATLLLCSPDGTPLTRALMYNDARAGNRLADIAAAAPPEAPVHSACASLAKLLWLCDQHPARNAHALHQAEWITGRLTGRFDLGDENNALKLGYDPVQRRWPGWLERLELPAGLLPTVRPAGTLLGPLRPELRARWGLPEAATVCAGTTDSTAAVIATGAEHIGQAVTVLGSTLVLKVLSPQPVFAPEYGIYSHRLGDLWLAGGASNAGGAVLRQHFSDAELAELTPRLRPDRPTCLEYYPLPAPGERFPWNDPQREPRLHPRPDSDLKFLQGILEGLARIERSGYRRLRDLGAPWPGEVLSSGGGAANAPWRVMRERLLRCPVRLAPQQEAAYGSARLAQGLSRRSG
ncbi:FGGY-family carbohydrate kinase [Thiohalobacter thiocyanaticus]|uniref:Carbohydrate kinase n=1 Tax=Thiohalobacter thiocyanaticus TaxID=585455 RepID=A0A426QML5_9GAMM|nr:FGGY-family carbohydrate kinase [Thiohalobacter thiocyanaticus]RRQ22967.1 carbohydrate kinase [Thiohalobacter thiocyanaticus]